MSKRAEEVALKTYPDKEVNGVSLVFSEQRRLFQEGYELAEQDLGWHPSTEHPPVDEEVIVLLGRYEDFPQIAFGHIVNQSIAIDYNGWNIPGVSHWMPMPKLKEEVEEE